MSVKKNYKAFTLIEILIVIVIIGIIMGMTMGFGGEQIGKLQTKTIEETYLDNLNILQNKMLASNYFEGEKIKKLILKIEKDKSIEYILSKNISHQIEKETGEQESITNSDKDITQNDSTTSYEVDRHHIVQNISNLGENQSTKIDKISITYRPYHLGCKIYSEPDNQEYKKITFQTKSKNKKTCYKLVGETCKYTKILCSSTLE